MLTSLFASVPLVCPPLILIPTFLFPVKVISTTLSLLVVPNFKSFFSKPLLLTSIPILAPETAKCVSRLSSVVSNTKLARLCILIIEELLPPETLPSRFSNVTAEESALPLPL